MLSSVATWLAVPLALSASQISSQSIANSVTAVTPSQLDVGLAPSIDLSTPAASVLASLTPTPLPHLTSALTAPVEPMTESQSGVTVTVENSITTQIDPAAEEKLVETVVETETPILQDPEEEPKIATVEADEIPMLDTPFWDRVRRGFMLPEYDDKLVRRYEKFFSRQPQYMARVVRRGELYLPYILKQLEYRGMPTELALLPIVESAFNPFAKSHANALGMWQFIAPTAKRYGVRQNWWYDGRRDVIDSTQAALDYLEFLHQDLYGDWLVAIAAYNGGESRMHREIKRNRKNGKETGFNHLRIKRETRHYVPKLIALRNIFRDPAKFNVELPDVEFKPAFDVVQVDKPVNLRNLAKLIGVTPKVLRKLNPGFKRMSTEPDRPARILVPLAVADDLRYQVATANDELYKTGSLHRVLRGESLSRIAQRFGLSVASLMQHNGLNDDVLQIGQTLRIPVGASVAAVAAAPQKRKHATGLTKVSHVESKPSNAFAQKLVYRVRPGDTLSTIAQRFRVEQSKLANWNRMNANDLLQRDQKLVIFVRY